MEFRYDTYCGLYCGACPFLLATERGRLAALVKGESIPEADAACHGCKSAAANLFCRDCELSACARGRGVAFCGDCGDYPCGRLTSFRNDKYAHHSVVFKNLARIRDAGAATWLVEQEARWRCQKCGERAAWYDGQCPNCGAPFQDCRAEEAGLDA